MDTVLNILWKNIHDVCIFLVMSRPLSVLVELAMTFKPSVSILPRESIDPPRFGPASHTKIEATRSSSSSNVSRKTFVRSVKYSLLT